MENKDKPAYPHKTYDMKYGTANGFLPGLTKREMFAMAAMQGILSNRANNDLDLMGVNTSGPLGFIAANFAAKEAVQYADALLKELDK